MSLIPPHVEPNRVYTHSLSLRYKESMNKREYIDENAELTLEEESQTIWSKLEFSLSPLLCEDYLKMIRLEDRIKIIKGSNPRNLWLFARMNHLEVTANAIKPCRAGTQLVEISDRTVILKKLIPILKQQSEQANEKPGKPHCIVVSDDRVPTLPVFELSDEETFHFLATCFGDETPTNTSGIPIPNPWNQKMKRRTFIKTYRWQNRVDIAPYMLLPRVIWDCTPNLNWRGIFCNKSQYQINDAVSTDMFYFVCLHNNYYALLGVDYSATMEQLEMAFLEKLKEFAENDKKIIELHVAFDVLKSNEKRARYNENVNNLQNRRFWKPLEQKQTYLLQVEAILPISVHNQLYGTPCSKGECPLKFTIDDHPQEQFYGTFETFYLCNSNFYKLLRPILPGSKLNNTTNELSMDESINNLSFPNQKGKRKLAQMLNKN